MKRKIKRALISVSDKTNLSYLLKVLKKNKIDIISSGGTYKVIKKLGYNCKEVSTYTNSPEILDGRVKTLNPKIHAGILNKRNSKSHQIEMRKNKYLNIDLVIVNFYPFERIFDKINDHKAIIENIDIGGPAMVRAAAKNYNDVTIITSIKQYQSLIDQINTHNCSTTLEFRERLSEEAFMNTAYYDAVISKYFNDKSKNYFPSKKIIFANLVDNLRYGENPHQKAALYALENNIGLKQLHGKKLSYNNYNDIFAALSMSKSLKKNIGTVIVKHESPCGVSINRNQVQSFKEALSCDPISAFGGIVSCNFKIKLSLANELSKLYLEVIVGNGFEKKALTILRKRKNLRVIDASNLKKNKFNHFVSNLNSLLVQNYDDKIFNTKNFKVVSKKKPGRDLINKLIFAFNVCRNVKSNAIVLTRNTATIGIGSGQTSRLDSCKIAIEKMNNFQKINSKDKILAASDAFFPFVDGIEKLVQSGVSAVVQPSGSIRDKEIIKFANKTGTILVFSKTRHFKH